MINVNNLERQHMEIKELILKIRSNITLEKVEGNIDILVKDINILAGKISIHINTEDKFLYPKLLESENKELNNIAKIYIKEMGSICEEFTCFKDSFNTKSKILKNKNEFLIKTKNILLALEKRVNKEESSLYPKIKLLY